MSKPEPPWDDWDDYAQCYGCQICGAAEAYRIHNPGCIYQLEDNCTVGAGVPAHHKTETKINIRKSFWRNILEFFKP